MTTATALDDKRYRQLVDDLFAYIDRAFEPVDPDLAESTVSQGTLTILLQGRTRFIISPQPPVRQVWAAYRDQAWHFDLDPQTGSWMDDRGRGLELLTLVERITHEGSGATVAVPRVERS